MSGPIDLKGAAGDMAGDLVEPLRDISSSLHVDALTARLAGGSVSLSADEAEELAGWLGMAADALEIVQTMAKRGLS